MRVLSIPGRHHENRYFGLMLDALERTGATIVPPTIGNAALFRYDVLHLNFPTHYITENDAPKAWLASLAFGPYLIAARLLGRAVAYTVHDVVPFRNRHPWLLARFLRLVHRVSKGFVFLSGSSRQEFTARYPEDAAKPWVLVPHGPYPATLLSAPDRAAQRRALGGGEDSVVLGFLGSIKPYKNLAALLEVPERLPDGRRTVLVVAGRVEAGTEAAVDAVLSQIPAERLVRLDKRLDDAELDRLIQAVDLVLLPYTKGSNSGVALLVLGNHGRLVGSGLPVFEELARSPGRPWAYSTAGGLALGEAVAAAVADLPTEPDRQALAAYLKHVGFDTGATEVAAFFDEIGRTVT